MIGVGYIAGSVIRQLSQSISGSAEPVPGTPAKPGSEYSSVGSLTQEMSRPGGLASASLVSHLLQRVSNNNHKGPSLGAVIELNPQALGIAQERDRERANGIIRGPLHGIPVLLKDNIHTGDQMQTSAGAFGLVGTPAAEDAFIVKQLRGQGAVILGKTNMSELAGFRGGDIPDGASSRGGRTRNPHRLEGDVGGSSSGSAVAVAAGFAPLAVGTETNGSIIIPAALNGVVGIKPSVGLLGRSGIIPASSRHDTPGPMARSVFDAALLLNAMSGRDPDDPAGADAPQGVDYTALLVPGALKDKRIGYPVSFSQGNDLELVENSPQFTKTLALLQAQGAILVPVNLRLADASRYGELLFADVKKETNDYLASRQGLPVKSVSELIAFNKQQAGSGPDNQSLLKEIGQSTLSDEAREQAWKPMVEDFRDSVDDLVNKNRLDAMVTDAETGNFFAVAIAGYPGISVPSGMDEDGMPTAAYFYGPRWSEATLLAVAHGYEQASQAIRKPGFVEG